MPTQTSGFRVEYEQDRVVLKLQDHRGVLIYQIPPAGALLLIQQEEKRTSRLDVHA